jgi:hypothetical protein
VVLLSGQENKIELRAVEVTSSLKGRCREDGVEEDECADENGDGLHDDRISLGL